MKKDEFIKWVPLSPFEIFLRHDGMSRWAERADEVLESLNKEKKENLKELLKSLLKKTSAHEACKVLIEISKYVSFSTSSVLDFCTQEKFSGLLGLNQVVNMTMAGLFSNLGVKKSPLSFGGITIDYDRATKLGLMLEEHYKLQGLIYKLSSDEQDKVDKIIKAIWSHSFNKNYPLHLLLQYGEMIKKTLGIVSNPIELGLKWQGIVDIEGKDYDFYPVSQDKQDNGFFQYLCIVLFSLKFLTQ